MGECADRVYVFKLEAITKTNNDREAQTQGQELASEAGYLTNNPTNIKVDVICTVVHFAHVFASHLS